MEELEIMRALRSASKIMEAAETAEAYGLPSAELEDMALQLSEAVAPFLTSAIAPMSDLELSVGARMTDEEHAEIAAEGIGGYFEKISVDIQWGRWMYTVWHDGWQKSYIVQRRAVVSYGADGRAIVV